MKLDIQRFALITVTASLSIDIEGLEEDLQRLEELKRKAEEKLEELKEKAKKAMEADKGLEQDILDLQKKYEEAKQLIEKKIEKIKKEIKKVQTQAKLSVNKVKGLLGDALAEYGNRVQQRAEQTRSNLVANEDNPWITPEIKEEVSNMSYKEKIAWLDNYAQRRREDTGVIGGYTTVPKTFGKRQAIINSLTPVQRTLYDIREKAADTKYSLTKNTSKGTGTIKTLFNNQSSILTDIKNRSNDAFLKIFGNKK